MTIGWIQGDGWMKPCQVNISKHTMLYTYLESNSCLKGWVETSRWNIQISKLLHTKGTRRRGWTSVSGLAAILGAGFLPRGGWEQNCKSGPCLWVWELAFTWGGGRGHLAEVKCNLALLQIHAISKVCALTKGQSGEQCGQRLRVNWGASENTTHVSCR